MEAENTTMTATGEVTIEKNGTYEEYATLQIQIDDQVYTASGVDKGIWRIKGDTVTMVAKEEIVTTHDRASQRFFESDDYLKEFIDGIPDTEPSILKLISNNGKVTMFPLGDDGEIIAAGEHERIGN